MRKTTTTSDSAHIPDLVRAIASLDHDVSWMARNAGAALGEPDAKILRFLLERGGAVSQARIAQRLGRSRTWTSRTVHRLVTGGLVEADLTDGPHRNAPVKLTPDGEARARTLGSREQATWTKALRQLSSRHRSDLRRALQLLQTALARIIQDERSAAMAAKPELRRLTAMLNSTNRRRAR